jgi:hypothetical protein
MPKLNDNLDVTINIRWLVKIVVILGLMTKSLMDRVNNLNPMRRKK